MRRLAWTVVKIGVSLGILAFLAIQAQRNNVFEDLVRQPKHWGLLAAACGLSFAALTLTLVRWFWLVRALDLPFRLREALRLGFLGYLFNLAPMGIVGGDLLKAVMLARNHPGRRPEAVVTVFMDRLIGLYVLFLILSTAILATGLWRTGSPEIRMACQAALAATGGGSVFIAILLLPDASRGKTTQWCGRLPYIGPMLQRLIEAVRMYRFRLGTLAVSAMATVVVHVLFTTAICLVARGLFSPAQPLSTLFVIYPLSSAAKVLPLNLGPFEAAFDLLYAAVPLAGATADEGTVLLGQGLIVALCYRIVELLCGAVGLCYYLGSRREVAAAEAEMEMMKEETPQEESA